VAAVVEAHGGVPLFVRTASDTLDDLSRAVNDSLARDVLVFSGGSSVGERDLILDVIGDRGQVLFHGISVKPGKPTAFGVIDGKPVFGLPGYPASCLTNAYVLLAPALRRIARLPPARTNQVIVPLGRRVVSAPGRHQFYTVRIEDGVAMPAFKASGDITSMSHADGYIEIALETNAVEAGELVTVTLF
jgi:molybdenum cofactor synthesis domain-containing protein